MIAMSVPHHRYIFSPAALRRAESAVASAARRRLRE
jgi:hypothetical protein